MQALLDTHAFLWLAAGDTAVPLGVSEIVLDPANEIFLSVISTWEIVVKFQLGKLPLPAPPEEYISYAAGKMALSSLPLTDSAVLQLTKLPPIHKDPFDRMMICQAMDQELTILTNDEVIRQYPVRALW